MNNTATYPIALLGLVADHRRRIKNGFEYDKYFPKAKGTYDIVHPNGNVKMTVDEMDAYVHETLSDTIKIAPILKGKTLADTCQNIWNFIYDHIQYKLDKEGIEELRRPRRTWHDRFTGVDCDCMSIFASSILTNLGIKHKFRITKYEANWQHVYVIVPLPERLSHYYVIDCVLNQFNYQKTFTDKFDHRMETETLLGGIPIARLGDIGETTINLNDELQAILSGSHFGCLENLDGLGANEDVAQPLLDSIYSHIVATRDYIRKNPSSVVAVGGANAYLKMLDYAIAAWNTPNREAALDALEKAEEQWNNKAAIQGFGDIEEYDFYIDGIGSLGKLKIGGKAKTFFKNIKTSVKAINTKIVDAHKKVGAKAKEVAKKAGKVIKKFLVMSNPLTLMMRAGFLLAMKVNLFQMAERLYPGYLTQSEAEKIGINLDMWNRSKQAVEKVSKVFETIGGKRSKLEKYIRTGRAQKKLNGIYGIGTLGEPYTTAATVVAAATALLTAAAKMKEAGVNKKEYDQLKKQSAQQSAKKTSSVKGLGEDESAEGGADYVPSDEEIEDSQKGLAKFISAIKRFFQRNKKTADQPASEIIAEEQNDTGTSDVIQEKAEEARQEAIAEGKSEEEANAIAERIRQEESEEGFFSKAGQFIKENPGKVAVGATLLTAALVLAFSPKARQKIGFAKKAKLQVVNGIGAVVKYRKGKRVKRSRRFLPKNSRVKRIVLK